MSAIRIAEFDTWRAGYGADTVAVYLAGTTTLASIFTNEALSVAAANPQTLLTNTVGSVSYGKFAVPLYVGVTYELAINSVDRTGVIRVPITTLDDADASEALIIVTGGSQAVALDDHLARRVDVRDFGEFLGTGAPGASSSTNTATLTTAMGVAAAAGGGFVELPGGTFSITHATIPLGVVLRGQGRGATTLQSIFAGNVLTPAGARAGLSRLTLDGATLVATSIGLYAANIDEIVLADVEIKRFEIGIQRKGGGKSAWTDLYISNCSTGYAAYGDAASGAGGALHFNAWRGGKVELCGTAGIDLKYVDQPNEHNQFHGVGFETNTGKAVWVRGARRSTFLHCHWNDNTNNLTVADISPATTLNTVIGLELIGGSMSGGTVALNDRLDLVAFRQMALASVAVTITAPAHNVHVEDCSENSVTIAGDVTAWRRARTGNRNAASINTTDGEYIKAWAITLAPGEHVRLVAKTLGRQINGGGYYFTHQSISAKRRGSFLAYELQTGNFTVGQVLTGGTSGASARLVTDADGGATGTLSVYDVVGTFVDGELITDGISGSATVNGAIVDQLAVILSQQTLVFSGQTVNFTVGQVVTGATSGATGYLASQTDAGATGSLFLTNTAGIFIDGETLTDGLGGTAICVIGLQTTGWALGTFENTEANYYSSSFYANGAQIELRVRGKVAQTLEWTVDVEVVSSSSVRA